MQTVLFHHDPVSAPMPNKEFLTLASDGAKAVFTDPASDLGAIVSSERPEVIVTNNLDERLVITRSGFDHKRPIFVLWTDQPMAQYSQALCGHDIGFLDSVIAYQQGRELSMQELRITLQKVIRKDIFGLDKYLRQGAGILSHKITGSADRSKIHGILQEYCDQMRLGGNITRMVLGIAEELMMNAVYDAPNEAGSKLYSHIPRSAEVTLRPEDQGLIEYGSDGDILALAVTDPFGALNRNKFFQYIGKVLRRNEPDQLIDKKETGAGLGIYKILYSCHSIACNVMPGKKTQVIVQIDLDHQLRDFSRMPRSIHFFEQFTLP